ncbi:energy-coupling factor ABC transporter ATP-binding protein [Afifella pfennigii]|uniref:energy-coupling factor ABC transporter ATP-binding protein n=1 Tax=Afifella pfennigii TaxID=209897 RepID=UPI00068F9FE9|nr:ABC transporter ATP-binding protein [Afifella pfennigii]
MSELISLQDIHFAYPGGAPVLCGLDLTLSAGERLSIGGHNGAGKSTLLHILVGLLRPSRGRVVAFGAERAEEKDFYEVRRRAGLVFQDPDDQLFCPTVAEDVAFGPLNLGKSRQEAMAIVEEVLARLDLAAYRDRITHKLSGGEKRLVTLAAVLAMEPDVLLLDEPTNALDIDNKVRLTEILLSLPQAMILVSHDHGFRNDIATRTLMLVEGRLTERPPRCVAGRSPAAPAA